MTWAKDYCRSFARVLSCAVALLIFVAAANASDHPSAEEYKKTIQPLLENYCYGCHAEGAKKGNVILDEFKSHDEMLQSRDLWFKVLKNVRAGMMPPPKKDKPSEEEIAALEKWIKLGVFEIDPEHPDPGRVTLRRLNRVEYRNTIRDLMGVDYRTDEEFPPDDTGYGFDTIADVLTVSPLLLEKYMEAAEKVVQQGVPKVSKMIRERTYGGGSFRGDGKTGENMTFYKPANVANSISIDQPGTYRVQVQLNVNGAFDFDPGKCDLVFEVNDEDLLRYEFKWEDNKKYEFTFEQIWEKGEKRLAFEMEPLVPESEKKTSVDMRIVAVKVEGPLEEEHWVRPNNFERFFSKDAPTNATGRREYAREVLGRFVKRAFRRPVDGKTVDRLTAIAEEAYSAPGKTFEEGVGRAMVAVLASPRFLFRVEDVKQVASADRQWGPVDEYALASRLSYFLWSTMPDDELVSLAERGELRQKLPEQVKRMMKDQRSKELVENFAGQWLQTRDVEGISIDARSVLARENAADREMEAVFARLRELREKRELETRKLIQEGKPVVENEVSKEEEELRAKLRQRRGGRGPRVELDGELRRAMRRETDMYFEHVLREDRSVLEFLDSNYTFLNERLARHYGVPGVEGQQMRKVELPEGNPRGGLLTQGTVLVVTSNPTRTSPVKRGLFVLDNLLGVTTPAPPPNLPELEESEKELKGKDKEPTLREVLELHRRDPMCSSCHNRMDPLGLALENFNAMGMYREQERGQEIEPAGKLITGETFTNVSELKKVLREKRKTDFYRCLTEKVLTYALGRGLEYYDVETVDRIVQRLEKDDGRFSTLLAGVIESAPFQQKRIISPGSAPQAEAGRKTTTQGEAVTKAEQP